MLISEKVQEEVENVYKKSTVSNQFFPTQHNGRNNVTMEKKNDNNIFEELKKGWV